MGIEINQIGSTFAAEVTGIDLLRRLTNDEVSAIEAGMDNYATLVFHDQAFDDDQQIEFSRNFGEIELAEGAHVRTEAQRRLKLELADVGNLDLDGKVFDRGDRRRMFNLGNQLWHSDSSFRPTPAKYSLLSARAIPTAGGNTEFADMRAAYDALDDETKAELEDLICEHSLIYSRGQLGFSEFSEEEKKIFTPVRQCLVRSHPVTGRKSLYLASHIGTIVDWPMPEARALIRDLTEHATKPEFVYSHKWKVGDLVMWDNRQTLHRARPFKDTEEMRDMRRTTIAGDGPTAAQIAA